MSYIDEESQRILSQLTPDDKKILTEYIYDEKHYKKDKYICLTLGLVLFISLLLSLWGISYFQYWWRYSPPERLDLIEKIEEQQEHIDTMLSENIVPQSFVGGLTKTKYHNYICVGFNNDTTYLCKQQ